jgi:ABC-type multidrug transport system ATPase subunit
VELEGRREARDLGTASAPVALLVEALSKTYDGTRALESLSFDARAGEIVGLVGPNGAGKTTALRSIAGVLPIQEGRVLVAATTSRATRSRPSAASPGCPTTRSRSTR